MNKLAIYVGYTLITLGVLLLTVILDFLPVDILTEIATLFSNNNEKTYYKIVPNENSNIAAYALLGVGVFMVVLSKYIKRKK